MSTSYQNTLLRSATHKGVGVHSGKAATVTLCPAPFNHGIVFKRTDVQIPAIIPASFKHVASTSYHTTLQSTHTKDTLATVEHLMAALWSLSVDNVLITVDGPEIPILDGSARPWMDLIQGSGLVKQKGITQTTPSVIKVTRDIRVQHQESWLQISPSNTFSVTMTMPLEEGLLHTHTYHQGDNFYQDISSARTFSRRTHIEHMKQMGLIKGGSLDNALVLEKGKPLNPKGFRGENECARHKILDLVGDWALAGHAFLGHVEGYASGHTLNYQLLKKLLESECAAQKPLQQAIENVSLVVKKQASAAVQAHPSF